MKPRDPAKSYRVYLFLGALLLFFLWLILGKSDDVVYEGPSDRFPMIYVTDKPDGIRQMRFSRDDIRQGEIKIGDVEYIGLHVHRAMLSCLMVFSNRRRVDQPPTRILHFGLGAASVANYIRKHFPNAFMEVVEWDGEVVKVAANYFDFDKNDPNTVVHVSEGYTFLKNWKQDLKYDIIIQDSCAGAPCPLASLQAFQKMASMLKEDGILFQHIYGWQASVIRNIQEAFPQSYVVDSGVTGKIGIGTKSSERLDKNQLMDRAILFKALLNPQFDPIPMISNSICVTETYIDTPHFLLNEKEL